MNRGKQTGGGVTCLETTGDGQEGEMRVSLGDIAVAFGKGIFAEVAGTAVVRVSSTMEMKLPGRPASSTPAQAAANIQGVSTTRE